MKPTKLINAIHSENWDEAVRIAKRHPEETAVWAKRGGFFDGKTAAQVLPLHEALVAGAPITLIKVLVQYSPWALRKAETSYKRLPLHCACRKQPRADVVAFLVQRYKDACLTPDSLNRLPIHYALTNGADPTVIRVLMKAHPHAAKGHDYRGWTPVHIALSAGASKEVVKLLLDANPEATLIRTHRGTSIRSCIPEFSPERDALKELVEEARDRAEHQIHLPSLRTKSLRASRMIMV